jgi:ABC-type nitrate/sulfonate/bicarbonate transport system substrate-binding protein
VRLFALAAAAGTWSASRLTVRKSLATATYSVANQYGFFTQNGLNVIYNQVPNSTAALASVLSGEYDVLTATVDNALNFRFNQNKTVTVLGQLDQGPDLVLASIPSITSVSQLKGKPIIVDSPTSGYAYLLQATLLQYGLSLKNGDYYFMVCVSRCCMTPDLLTWVFRLSAALPSDTLPL